VLHTVAQEMPDKNFPWKTYTTKNILNLIIM
jgi:hypothetical protein